MPRSSGGATRITCLSTICPVRSRPRLPDWQPEIWNLAHLRDADYTLIHLATGDEPRAVRDSSERISASSIKCVVRVACDDGWCLYRRKDTPAAL